MKKANKSSSRPKPTKALDFRSGVRGKYAARYARGANVVVIAPDLAEYFPDSDSVNHALRAIQAIIEERHSDAPRHRRAR